jgi:sensor domain CHASE-containing protein
MGSSHKQEEEKPVGKTANSAIEARLRREINQKIRTVERLKKHINPKAGRKSANDPKVEGGNQGFLGR